MTPTSNAPGASHQAGRLAVPRWPGWRHLPREARDTLFLLAVIGWTVLPHLSHLPWWCGALTAVVLAWRASLVLGHAKLPGRASITAVLVVAAGLTYWSEQTLIGREAGVTMLVVLMALKTLELRARRDALVVFFLGFFLVLTQFLYSQSMFTAAAMLGSVWGLLTALVLANMPVGRPPLRHAGWLAARTALIGAPVMVLLFVLFPRLGPLWGMPQEPTGRTGLSSSMRIGQVAELANDDSIAFRVRFPAGSPPSPGSLYFRGPVLASFDGEQWRRETNGVLGATLQAQHDQVALRRTGPAVPYEVMLEPLRQSMLPVLEATPDGAESAPKAEGWRFTAQADLSWLAERPVDARLRYTAVAWPDHRHGEALSKLAQHEATQLPAAYNPRTMAWAAQLHRQPRLAQADARTLAAAVMQHIRTQGYTYTLAPGTYGTHSVDEFWLDRRQGFCEHFAAAFVVVMRTMDVPARVVTGYQGTDPEPVDGHYIVRQSHAHAWAEFWQPGEGWVRADPTAAVAPDRIDRSLHLEPVPGLMADALRNLSPEAVQRLRAAWERLNQHWSQSVLSYSRVQQFGLLRELGVQSPDWADLGRTLVLLIAAGGLIGAGWAWWDRRRVDPWQRLYGRIREELVPLGIDAATHLSPRALAQRVRTRWGAAGSAVAGELELLDQARYGRAAWREPDPAWWRRFAQRTFDLRAGSARPG